MFAADGPGVRRRRLPGRELHAGRPQQGHVPGPSPALGRRGPPGPGRVRRDDRSSVAPAAPERAAVGSPGAATGPRAAGCVSCTGSGGTAPGDPTCTGGWPTRRRSRRRRPARSARWSTAICGRRRRCRSATPTPTPGRSTGGPPSTCSSAGSTRSRSPPRRSSGWACSARSCVWRSSTCCSAATTSGPPRPCPRWSWRWCGPWPPPTRCRCWTGPRTTGGPGSGARRRATPPCAHC